MLKSLRSALKNVTAKNVIKGLTRSGEQYNEAITCPKSRNDRPRLLHQTQIPHLKDGTGKELHQLHDVAQQHLRALKALGHEPDESFITSMLELKLDVHTMFEWQCHRNPQTFLTIRNYSASSISVLRPQSLLSQMLPNKLPEVISQQRRILPLSPSVLTRILASVFSARETSIVRMFQIQSHSS